MIKSYSALNAIYENFQQILTGVWMAHLRACLNYLSSFSVFMCLKEINLYHLSTVCYHQNTTNVLGGISGPKR